jgi:hypothetical protein
MKLKFTFTSLNYFNFIERSGCSSCILEWVRVRTPTQLKGLFLQQRKAEGESILLPSTHPPPLLLNYTIVCITTRTSVIQLFGSEYTGTTDVSGTTLTSIDVPVGGKTVSRFDVTTSSNVDATKIKLAVPTAAYNSGYTQIPTCLHINALPSRSYPHGKFSVLHV